MAGPLAIRFTGDDASRVQASLLAIPIFEGGHGFGAALRTVDAALGGLPRAVMEEEGFKGKLDQQTVLHTHGRIGAARVMLLGAGSAEAFDPGALPHLAARATRAAGKLGLASVAWPLDAVPRARDRERTVALAVLGAELGRYRFDRYMTGDRKKPDKLVELVIVGARKATGVARGAARGQRTAAAVTEVRDLVNEPAIVCTPVRLAEHAKGRAKAHGLECKVLGPEECRKLGMHLYLGVGMGSDNQPRFIHLAHKPRGARKRIVMIGKGVTFDSGGLSLKPANAMETMKCDMAGSATVIASIAAAADLGCKHEVHAIVAACENMPSGKSYRPGDVITGLGGKSIEVSNTDAEGRLTLADALAYAVKLEPDEMVDVATLTGACMVALGPDTAGVMGSDALVSRVLANARRAGEAMWRLPLPDRLKEQLKSEVADMKNTGERFGGALTAGLFLREFTDGRAWAHIDIAGPAFTDKEWGAIAKGGTGFGVATIVGYLLAK